MTSYREMRELKRQYREEKSIRQQEWELDKGKLITFRNCQFICGWKIGMDRVEIYLEDNGMFSRDTYVVAGRCDIDGTEYRWYFRSEADAYSAVAAFYGQKKIDNPKYAVKHG